MFLFRHTRSTRYSIRWKIVDIKRIMGHYFHSMICSPQRLELKPKFEPFLNCSLWRNYQCSNISPIFGLNSALENGFILCFFPLAPRLRKTMSVVNITSLVGQKDENTETFFLQNSRSRIVEVV